MNLQEENLEFKIAKSKKELQACFDIRNQVFTNEQNVDPKYERDGKEEVATHFLAFLDKTPVGTARFFKVNDDSAKISRVAVLSKYRGKEIGKVLINEIINYSKKLGISTLILSSQSSVMEFYERFGFKTQGEEFLEANIPHYKMHLDIMK
ncbi:MAG: GNAT family N-acetyltransferase [Candidatus Gastranaerophilales bacterium]|nr:GNAT family N-acetyltransferase [Candidatus Gastranaerophilales bacterium]